MDVGALDTRISHAPRTPTQSDATEPATMDALVIQGGRTPDRARRRSAAPRTPRCRSWRRRCSRPACTRCATCRCSRDTRTMARVLEQLGARVEFRGHALQDRHLERHLGRGALRPGAHDARQHLRAGSAARALRRGARLAARRLRLGPAPGEPAPRGPERDGRRARDRARLHRRARTCKLRGARLRASTSSRWAPPRSS